MTSPNAKRLLQPDIIRSSYSAEQVPLHMRAHPLITMALGNNWVRYPSGQFEVNDYAEITGVREQVLTVWGSVVGFAVEPPVVIDPLSAVQVFFGYDQNRRVSLADEIAHKHQTPEELGQYAHEFRQAVSGLIRQAG